MGRAGTYRSLIYWLGGMACVLLFFVLWGRDALVSVGLGSGAIAFFSAAAGMRCPRCGLGIDSREHAGYAIGYVPDAQCPKCGRERRGVWPFQFLFKPERRDLRSPPAWTSEKMRLSRFAS